MIELDCTVKHEDWGKLGSSSFVGQLLKSQRRKVSESKPYAELWMGTHQSGPSRVTNLSPDFDTKPIDSVLKAWPEFVGNVDITQKYGQNLPILVKILSVNRPSPLQINVNPSEDDPATCKIVIAMTPATLFCGFKPHDRIINNLERFSILRSLISPSSVSSYVQSVTNNDSDCDVYLTKCFNEALRNCQMTDKAILFENVAASGESIGKVNLLKRLMDKNLIIHGLVAFFFLNFIQLIPDQAISISSNQIHSYLDGNYLEVSNPNDQVIGIETDMEDHETRSSYSTEFPNFILPVCVDKTSHLYTHESSNLTVELLNANDGEGFVLTSDYKAAPTPSGSFILVLGLTEVTVNNVYRIKPGQIFFVPPGLPLRFTHMRGAFRLFRVSLKL